MDISPILNRVSDQSNNNNNNNNHTFSTPLKLPSTPNGNNTTSSSSNTPSSTTTSTTNTTTTTTTPTQKTYRLEVNLSNSNEVDYQFLVKDYRRNNEQRSLKINDSFYQPKSGNTSLVDSFDSDILPALPKNRLTEVIDRIERIHDNVSDGDEDSEDRYDSDDSFIDNSESVKGASEVRNNYGGFFVHAGDLEEDESLFDDEYEQPVKSKRKIRENIDSTPSTRVTKKPKAPSVSTPANDQHLEELILKLEDVIKNFPDDLKLLPRTKGPLLASIYNAITSSNQHRHLSGPYIQRIASFWPLKEKTIKQHLKKAWEDNGEKTKTKAEKLIEQLNDQLKNLSNTMIEAKNARPAGSDSEYSWTKDCKERLYQMVALNKEICELKNTTSLVNADNEGKGQPQLIIEKTSRGAMYKRLVQMVGDETFLNHKSISKQYMNVRTNIRKKEKREQISNGIATPSNTLNNSSSSIPTPTSGNGTSLLSSTKPTPPKKVQPSPSPLVDHPHLKKEPTETSERDKEKEKERRERKEKEKRDRERDKESKSGHSSSDKHRDRDKDKSTSSSSSDKHRERDKDRERERDKDKSTSRDKDKSSSRDKSERSSSSSSDKHRDREKDREREKERERRKEKERRKERDEKREKEKKNKKQLEKLIGVQHSFDDSDISLLDASLDPFIGNYLSNSQSNSSNNNNNPNNNS